MATVAEAAHKDRILVSPLARRLAKQAGLDLASLQGSGPHNRIIKRDIEAALGAGRDGAPAGQAVATVPSAASRSKLSICGHCVPSIWRRC